MNLKTLLLLPVAALFIFSGCVDSNTDEGESSGRGNNPLNAPADYMGALQGAQRSAESTAGQATLNQAIRHFQVMEERFPRDLNELVSQGYLPVLPAAPRGSFYQYNPQTGALTVERQ